MSGPLSGIVLAGGSGQRLGADKASLTFDGQTLLEIIVAKISPLCSDVIVAYGSRHLGEGVETGTRFVPDAVPGQGPLAGLQAGLAAACEEFALVVACDMPFLNPRLLAYMAALPRRYEALVPLAEDRWHTAHAIYARSCLPVIDGLLAQGGNRMEDLIWRLDVQPVPEEEVRRFDPDALSLFNLNTPADLALARTLWGQTSAGLEVTLK